MSQKNDNAWRELVGVSAKPAKPAGLKLSGSKSPKKIEIKDQPAPVNKISEQSSELAGDKGGKVGGNILMDSVLELNKTIGEAVGEEQKQINDAVAEETKDIMDS